MVTRPGLMTGDRPLLEDWTKVFKKKWQTKVCGFGTVCIGALEELSAIRRIVMRKHLYWTVRSSDL